MKKNKLPESISKKNSKQLPSRTAAVRIVICFLSLSVLWLFYGCSREKTQGSDNTHKDDNAQHVISSPVIMNVSQQKVEDTLSAVGTVLAYQEVQISPEITGKIKKIHFNTGDYVKKGHLLLEIDDESRAIVLQKKKALLKKARAAKLKSEKDAQKANTLFKEGIISDSECDDVQLDRQIAEAEFDLAFADVMAAEKELRDTKIRAPFDGRVALKEAEIGKLVSPGQTLLTLVEIKKVKILIDISELDITKITRQSKVEVTVDSLPGHVFSGRVETIGLKADDSTRTFPVEIVVFNKQGNLLPGMVARVSIISTKPKNVIIIPKRAIRILNGVTVVYVTHSGKLEKRRIYLGPEVGDNVIVESGLKGGENLIIEGEMQYMK